MGMDPATLALLIPAIGSIASSGVSSAFAPSPFQARKSFAGTSADPVRSLTNVQDTLRNLLAGQMTKMNHGAQLPDATTAADLPSFTGGGLPMPIGVRTNRADLTKPLQLPGMGLDAGTVGAAGSYAHGPATGDPDPANPNPGQGPGGNSPGNSNYYFDQAVQPKTVVPSGSPATAFSPAGPSTGAPLDARAMAAIRLLMHATQPQQAMQGAA